MRLELGIYLLHSIHDGCIRSATSHPAICCIPSKRFPTCRSCNPDVLHFIRDLQMPYTSLERDTAGRVSFEQRIGIVQRGQQLQDTRCQCTGTSGRSSSTAIVEAERMLTEGVRPSLSRIGSL
eukprot:m.446007 g.446007  ORF g.446007 m.446007 type:complete len:123 (+) comp21497_c0_seq25:2288-2656(+)